jgi:transposase
MVLANAQNIKAVPGRKTDMKDCQWISELLKHGLLRGSYVPSLVVRDLRDLTRTRATLSQEQSSVGSRIQKVLESANIKLSSTAQPRRHAARAGAGSRSGARADRADDAQGQAVRSADPRTHTHGIPRDPATAEVHEVGHITALTYVLTLGNKQRFKRSWDVGCFLGLRPRRSQSGDRDPQLRITKAGNIYLRSLLIECANHILRPQRKDSSLRRWVLHLADRGGKQAKNKAVVAVARKLKQY